MRAKKLQFYDLLQTLAFKHCDGVMDIQVAPASDNTDAVSSVPTLLSLFLFSLQFVSIHKIASPHCNRFPSFPQKGIGRYTFLRSSVCSSLFLSDCLLDLSFVRSSSQSFVVSFIHVVCLFACFIVCPFVCLSVPAYNHLLCCLLICLFVFLTNKGVSF